MVTKHKSREVPLVICCVLAKIHMVTKHALSMSFVWSCCVLAKIHMVTKPDSLFFVPTIQLCSSKNSYGNKTISLKGFSM